MRLGLAVAVVLAATAPAIAQDDAALAEKGRALSVEHCKRCHVIDEKNRFSGISSTPSFPLLVNAFDDWETRFRSFTTRLPHPSVTRFEGDPGDPTREPTTVPIVLKQDDIDAFVAYARTLRKKK